MKKIRFYSFIIFAYYFVFVGGAFAYKEVIFETIDKKAVNVIRVVLDGKHYVVSSASLNGNTLEELTKKVGGDTSINGVFFCPADYSGCNNQNSTVFERVYLGDAQNYSTFWPDTGIRGVFGFDRSGTPLFVQNNLTMNGLGHNTNSHKMDEMFFGLGNFPVLLIQGEDVIWRSEEFMDTKMKTRGTKSFICSTKDQNTIFMGNVGPVNLYELGPFVKKNFGCYDAINLDAGSSLGMIYDGRVIARGTRRQIMDAFVVLTKDQYEKLTSISAPVKNISFSYNDYQLNKEDLGFVEKFSYIINKQDSTTKKKVKTTIRNLLGSKLKANKRGYQILREIFLRVATIDQI